MSAITPIEPNVIDIKKLTDAVASDYSNFTVAHVNDHVIRVSVMKCDFHWHVHEDSDESFLVLEGELIIDFDHQSVTLGPGELLTVPSGVRHRTRSTTRSVNLTFEHRSTHSGPCG